MGSKNRISKELKPIIESYLSSGSAYIEPFVGGANMIDKIDHDKKIGYDIHDELIALLIAVRDGYEPPEEVTPKHYHEVRDSYRAKDGKYEDYYYGAIGFLASFRSIFFMSEGCRDYESQGRVRNNYGESMRNLMRQAPKLKGTTFKVSDYRDIKVPDGSVVYCDPPYQKTNSAHGYKHGDFNHEEYWDWVRKVSKKSTVLCSEYSAPGDFECIWEKEVSTNLAPNSRKRDIERLYIYTKV